jgi:hypothetical protein
MHTNTIIITPPHVKMSINMTWENYFLNQMMYVSLNNTTTDVTYGAGDTNISGAPEFTTGFSEFCVMFCRSLSVILRFTDSDLFWYLQTFLHSLIHSFESCIHAQGRQLIQLYGVKFVAVTNSTSRCEMTSLRAIYRHLVVFNRYSGFHYYLNLVFMMQMNIYIYISRNCCIIL